MMRKHPRLLSWIVGASFGLIFGVSYWFAWGCRNCAKDNSPIALVAFCVVVGVGMAHAWGRDHVRGGSA